MCRCCVLVAGLHRQNLVQASPAHKSKTASNIAMPTKRASKPRQAITLGPHTQNPDGSTGLTRSMSIRTASPLPAAADRSAGASPSQQDGLESDDDDNLTKSNGAHRISSAITAGLSGVQDVGKLLMRQPSVHPPTRTPKPTPSPTPTPIFNPLLRPSSQDIATRSDSANGLQGQLSTNSSPAGTQVEPNSAGLVSGALSNAGVQQGFRRQSSRMQRGNGKQPLGMQSEISPRPTLQLSLPVTAARNSPAVAVASTTTEPVFAADHAAESSKQRHFSQSHDQHSSHPALLAAQKPSEQHSTAAENETAASLPHVTAKAGSSAADSLARGSRKFGKTASVSFLLAVDAHQLGADQTVPSSGSRSMSATSAMQTSSSSAAMQASIGGGKLTRYSSTLASAVGETMQDRMMAGGMMRRHNEDGFGSGDSCVWTKANPADRCPWPRSAEGADRCVLPRSISKTLTSGSNDLWDDMGMPFLGEAQGSMEALTGSGKRMPIQLSKHRSNLSKVSKRSDFAATMNAVRENWVADQHIAKSTMAVGDSAQLDAVHQRKAMASDSPQHTNLDSVWQSISHHA